MMGLFRRFGFAAVVVAGLALMLLVVVGKSATDAVFGGDNSAAPAAPGPGGRGGPGGGGSPAVLAVAAGMHTFTDGLQAIGTAQALESIVLTPKVADTIRRLRFESGDRVRAGQVLVEMSSVEQAADLAEVRASNQAAQEDLRRTQELFDRGFASQARLDTVRAAAEAAEARLNAGGSRIADRTIRAPFAGIVGLRLASPGQYVRPGDQIGTLDDTSQIKLDFTITETQIARVQQGVELVARTSAYPDQTFTGSIASVDSRIDPATRTVRVRAILPNADGTLRPGMLMTVDVRSNPRQALAIPEIAILDQIDGAYVYRVVTREGAQSVELVRISTGQRAGGMAEVLEGLNPGDRVITEGVQSVRPGQTVQIGDAPPAAEGSLPLRPRGR
ncbi:MAG: efflux RND transporter periplasmic adaptor subunit [Hyphomonadaceae bacterium]|nr:efflux RND transporter periplasmic adaptor subunit [Hyphomonadaceae bacterium]